MVAQSARRKHVPVFVFDIVRYRSRDCSRATRSVARKPASLTYEQAAAVPVAGITASIALNKARGDNTASVFIAGGAGGAGTFTILLARQLGVRNLVTTAGNAKSRDYLIAHCGLSDDQIIDFVRNKGFTVYHPVGTCKMGSDAAAVVDQKLRVHGMQNLRVIDASVMPAVTSGNTNAPVIMIAEKAADSILRGE